MTRALVLNAGSSWGAYQIGALEYLVGRRRQHFDVCAGTGIGAMNAAFVACGKFDELTRFWDTIRMRSLVTPHLRAPWRAPLTNTPQRRFVAAHIDERALIDRGTSLAVSVVDLRSGREVMLRYPGAGLPLVDGIMAATATPGLVRPIRHGRQLLAEATLVESVPMAAVADPDGAGGQQVGEIVAVLTGLPIDGGERRRYSTWRAVAERSVAMNLAHDARRAVENHAADAAFATGGATVATAVNALADTLADRELAGQLRSRLTAAVAPLEGRAVPQLTAIVPTRELGYPLWRFRRPDLAAARALGCADAEAAVG